MKAVINLFFILLFTGICSAQDSINYKAVIKDAMGNIVANQLVTVRFTILERTISMYQETHSPTTDNNGIVILSIGEGTSVFGNSSIIDWGSDSHNLKVEIDTGTGLIDLGTIEFKAVPYALNVTGLETITENGKTGWRLKGRDPANHGDIGNDAMDLSFSNTPSSIKGATGTGSTAIGFDTEASGSYSSATGVGTKASGFSSNALGSGTEASGLTSVAMGTSTEASGLASTTMGAGTKAISYASLAIGAYNIGYGSNPTSPRDADPVLEIGNGTSNILRSNVLTVLKNGNVGIDIDIPVTKLQITGGDEVDLTDGDGYLLLGNVGGKNMVFDVNEIMARDDGETAAIALQSEGGAIYVGGILAHTSDVRLKEDISDLSYGLNEVLLLKPKSYYWKNRDKSQKSFGLIAQEVQLVINELVLERDDKEKTLTVNYTELTPILINAIQEQQVIINSEKTKVLRLEEKLARFDEMDERLKAIELRLNN